MASLTDVLDYIKTLDSSEDFDRLLGALESTRERLEAAREAAVRLDATVGVKGVTPAWLNGLEGEVIYIDEGEREAYLLLNPESTGTLRFHPDNNVYEVGSADRYVLPRVPLSCCIPVADAPGVVPLLIDADEPVLTLEVESVQHHRTLLRAV